MIFKLLLQESIQTMLGMLFKHLDLATSGCQVNISFFKKIFSFFNESYLTAGLTEHDIDTQDTTTAQNSCYSKCSQSSASAFSGLRYSAGKFKCTCLDNSFSDVFFEVILILYSVCSEQF